ncbi:hypothetical protein O181_063236 [Austropuccinia psidii MF-1]|uniref:Uncharacterized protein n=1 Tax=Austropuccinia psidii MF-1 TaxID=1389203 RepID=A0A9Q3ERC4_9BASI|nr:hypothetical protein [Austropuccinia psidii MF-1]
MIQHKIHKLGKQSCIAPKKPTSDALPLPMPTAIGRSTIGTGNASTPGLSQRMNDIGQDGAASLLTRPAPVHSLDGAGPLGTWSPTHPTDGG